MHTQEVGILVVEDVQVMLTQITEMLKQIGFSRVVSVASCTEAKALLKEKQFQLVLCDWHMEGVDGLQLLQFLKSNIFLNKIPFIMLTAEGTQACVIEAVQCGLDDYILKPVTADQLRTKVYRTLFKKGIL